MHAMQTEIFKRLGSLPKREASFVEPMECLSVSKLPEDSRWLWEIKLDGYRAIAVKSASDVKLFSRQEKSLNTQFPYIVEGLADLPAETVVDGELVAIDDSGRPDFNLLQSFRSEASRIHYYVFDLLCCKGRDITHLPLIERRALLTSVVAINNTKRRVDREDSSKATKQPSLWTLVSLRSGHRSDLNPNSKEVTRRRLNSQSTALSGFETHA